MFLFRSSLHLYCWLHHAQHCYLLLIGKVADGFQESFNSEEYYQEDGIKSVE